MQAKCANCRFWEKDTSLGDVGQCRRYAPGPSEHGANVVAAALVYLLQANKTHPLFQHYDSEADVVFHLQEGVVDRTWQRVYEDDWCGEFEPKDEPRSAYSDEVDIRSLPLRKGVINPLVYSGFLTVGSVRRARDSELLRIPNFGRKALSEVRQLTWSDRKGETGQ